MMRSFHYAAYAALLAAPTPGRAGHVEDGALGGVAEGMAAATGTAGSPPRSCARTCGGRRRGVPAAARADLDILLDALLLEKAVYELRYEVDNRPDWVPHPAPGRATAPGVGAVRTGAGTPPPPRSRRARRAYGVQARLPGPTGGRAP